jgi:chaperone required for assembly of F1-ATPase
MTGWTAKRFWKEARVAEAEGGFTVHLDARPVKTPAKAALIVPTRALAEAIAAEWDAQPEKIDPRTMPVTRTANSAIDKVRVQQAEVTALLAAYGESDHLCYRAAGPEALVARQVAAWDPLLDWAAAALGARLIAGQGVMHVAQDQQAVARLHSAVAAFDPFRLAAVHDLISLSGSLVLALAVTRGHMNPEDAWILSRIDEDWQAEQWGADDEATAHANIKRAAFLDAARFYQLCLP